MKKLLAGFMLLGLSAPCLLAQSIEVAFGEDGYEVVTLVNGTGEVIETAALCYLYSDRNRPMFIWSPSQGRILPGARVAMKSGDDPNYRDRTSDYSVCMVVRESEVKFYNERQMERVLAYFEEAISLASGGQPSEVDDIHANARRQAQTVAQFYRNNLQAHNVVHLIKRGGVIISNPMPEGEGANALRQGDFTIGKKCEIVAKMADPPNYGCSGREPQDSDTMIYKHKQGPVEVTAYLACQCSNPQWDSWFMSMNLKAKTTCQFRTATVYGELKFEKLTGSQTGGIGVFPIASESGEKNCGGSGDYYTSLTEPSGCP